MRILGGLRNWFKLVSLCFFSIVTSGHAAAEVITSYEGLLRRAFAQSAEYQKITAQLDVETLDAESFLALYNWSLSGGVSRIDSEKPVTNPFAPNKQSSMSYNLRLQKNSISGVNPFVEMTSTDANLSFPNGNSSNFQTASLEAGLRIDVMKTVLLKNSIQAFSQVETKRTLAKLSQKAARQKFSTKILRAYYHALKNQKAFEILETQCSEYSRLQRISSRRFKKKLMQEKNYLTVEVLYQNCLLDKKTAENNRSMADLSLLKTAGLPLDTKINFKKVKFSTKKLGSANIDISKNLDYRLAKELLKSSEQSAASLKSDLLPELNFSYGLKSEAAGTSLGNSIGEAAKFDQLTHNLGLNLKYEFGSSASKTAAKRALAFQAVKKNELVEIERSLGRDAKNISQNIFYLNSGLSKARSLVNLQERKARLFRRDFSNGRGSIRDLVEAQIAYLSSLERELRFQFNLSISNLDLIQIKGEQVEKSN